MEKAQGPPFIHPAMGCVQHPSENRATDLKFAETGLPKRQT
jgi:hypothetical protein